MHQTIVNSSGDLSRGVSVRLTGRNPPGWPSATACDPPQKMIKRKEKKESERKERNQRKLRKGGQEKGNTGRTEQRGTREYIDSVNRV